MSPESNPAIELFELENLRKDRDFLLGEQKRLRSEVERLDRELSAEKQERVKEQGRVERLRGALQYIETESGERTIREKARAALQPEPSADGSGPYITRSKLTITREWNPKFDQLATCECGHPYERHFDSCDEMEPVGCKYCRCDTFKALQPEQTNA